MSSYLNVGHWKGGFGLWWRMLLDFLSRTDGGSCRNKKNRRRRKRNFNIHSLHAIPSLQSARLSWPNYSPAMQKSLPTATVVLRESRPFRSLRSSRNSSPFAPPCSWTRGIDSRPDFPVAAVYLRQNHMSKRKKWWKKIQTQTPICLFGIG